MVYGQLTRQQLRCRRILSERHGLRIAVIMNEFGDTVDLERWYLPLSRSCPEMFDISN
jgi:G3E family GTPase